MNFPPDFLSDRRLAKLRKRRESLGEKLNTARKEFLEARARKNALESECERLDSEIEIMTQGQLCLNNRAEA
jgi:chromosome segregation ATPase